MSPRLPLLLVILFAGAIAGLLMQILTTATLSQRLLATALLLLGIDQTRMAIVDLRNIAILRLRADLANSQQLDHFSRITSSTIALELIGFYTSYRWLGWGCIVVLLSQLWFNLLAGVQLAPQADIAIQDCGVNDRSSILLADSIAIMLAILYTLTIAPLATAIALLSMVSLYGCIKYWLLLSAKLSTESAAVDHST
jgi:hypothetical protein